MTNPIQLKCPRDSKPLKVFTLEDISISCCGQCRGVLVPQKSLNSLLEKMSQDLMKTISLDHPINKMSDKGANVLCPQCSKKMENFGYMGTNVVMIDSCHVCRHLWMDTGELGVMSILYARTKKREGQIREKEKKQIEEQNRVFDAAFLSDMTVSSMENIFYERFIDEFEEMIGIPDPVFAVKRAQQVVDKATRFLEDQELKKKLEPHLKKKAPDPKKEQDPKKPK